MSYVPGVCFVLVTVFGLVLKEESRNHLRKQLTWRLFSVIKALRLLSAAVLDQYKPGINADERHGHSPHHGTSMKHNYNI